MVEQASSGLCDSSNGLIEGLLVVGSWLSEAADLAHILQGGCLDVGRADIFSERWAKGLDASAHGRRLSPNVPGLAFFALCEAAA